MRCAVKGGRPCSGGSVLCLLDSLCPVASRPAPAWDSLACWRGPCLREPRFLLQGGPSSQPWARATGYQHQPPGGLNLSMGRKTRAVALGKVIVRTEPLLAAGQEGLSPGRGEGPSAETPRKGGLSLPRGYQALGSQQLHIWECNMQTPPGHGRKGDALLETKGEEESREGCVQEGRRKATEPAHRQSGEKKERRPGAKLGSWADTTEVMILPRTGGSS